MRTEGNTDMNELEELRRRIAELEDSEANRKRAWEALEASEVWYRTLAENLPGIVYRVYIRESSRMQFFNNMLLTMTGYKVEELEGSQVCSFESLILPEDRADMMATVKNAIIEDKAFEVEYRLKHKDGRIRYFFERGRPIRGTDGKPLHIDGVILDITERKLAEEAVRESEERYHTVLEASPDPIVAYDMKGKGTYINPAFARVFGWLPEELLGKKLDYVPDENWPETQMMIEKVQAGQSFSGVESRRYTKEGKILDVSISAAIHLNRDSIPVGSVHILRDITERKHLEAQLAHASKMANLGEMATGIAHELNQPLNVMRMGGDFLAKMIRRGKEISDDQLMKVSRNITEQVERAANLTNHLREFGRKSDFKVFSVDLNEPIRDVFTIMGQHLKSRNIEVKLDLDERLPKIMSDKNRLEQIFLNLVTNARDAMETRGPEEINKLTVATYQEGDRVVAEVSDTGTGMPERIQRKIFNPFFTTKEVGKGTGLGMWMCHGIIESHNGKIEVESKEGEGTTVRVILPTANRSKVLHY